MLSPTNRATVNARGRDGSSRPVSGGLPLWGGRPGSGPTVLGTGRAPRGGVGSRSSCVKDACHHEPLSSLLVTGGGGPFRTTASGQRSGLAGRARPEDGGADPHDRRALGDRRLEVTAHAHRQLPCALRTGEPGADDVVPHLS